MPKEDNMIDDVILSLKDENEDDKVEFLGVSIELDVVKGKTKLTQYGLICRILQEIDLEDTNPSYTPDNKVPLSKDLT